MGEQTGIGWTDSTANGWHGCDKVSAGCKHCYAEVSTPVRVKRAGGLELWGVDAGRSETKSWERDLRRWDRARRRAIQTPDRNAVPGSGRPWFVFAQSLSDTFEDYTGGRVVLAGGNTDPDLTNLRQRFLEVVEECSALTFQLLTKRPENVARMVPASWLTSWPAHVWIGCTVEDQERADERIPELLSVPASAVKFLSVEPQLGHIDLTHWLECKMCRQCGTAQVPIMDAPTCRCPLADDGESTSNFRSGMVDWVIQGGESGSKARPFDLAWARSMRDACKAAGVAYFLKQLGARPVDHVRESMVNGRLVRLCDEVSLHDSHGGDESEWPADLRNCRAFPVPT